MTVGELRTFLARFTDETPVVGRYIGPADGDDIVARITLLHETQVAGTDQLRWSATGAPAVFIA